MHWVDWWRSVGTAWAAQCSSAQTEGALAWVGYSGCSVETGRGGCWPNSTALVGPAMPATRRSRQTRLSSRQYLHQQITRSGQQHRRRSSAEYSWAGWTALCCRIPVGTIRVCLRLPTPLLHCLQRKEGLGLRVTSPTVFQLTVRLDFLLRRVVEFLLALRTTGMLGRGGGFTRPRGTP